MKSNMWKNNSFLWNALQSRKTKFTLLYYSTMRENCELGFFVFEILNFENFSRFRFILHCPKVLDFTYLLSEISEKNDRLFRSNYQNFKFRKMRGKLHTSYSSPFQLFQECIIQEWNFDDIQQSGITFEFQKRRAKYTRVWNFVSIVEI